MPYYRGDYVGGPSNYYRGDPFLGALVGGIVGKAASKVGRWVGSKVAGTGARRAAGTAVDRIVDQLPGVGVGMAIPQLLPALPGLGPGRAVTKGGQWPTNKDGSPRRVRKDGKPWKRPTLNPLNPRALNRALRRAEGFEKFAKRTVNALYRVVDGRRTKTFKRKTRSR